MSITISPVFVKAIDRGTGLLGHQLCLMALSYPPDERRLFIKKPTQVFLDFTYEKNDHGNSAPFDIDS